MIETFPPIEGKGHGAGWGAPSRTSYRRFGQHYVSSPVVSGPWDEAQAAQGFNCFKANFHILFVTASCTIKSAIRSEKDTIDAN